MSNFGVYDLNIDQSVNQTLINIEEVPLFRLTTNSDYVTFPTVKSVLCSPMESSGTTGPTGFLDYANTVECYNYNDTFVSFNIYVNDYFMNAGLSNDISSNNITYGIYTVNSDLFEIVYNNGIIGDHLQFQLTDTFRIETNKTGVYYYQNYNLIYSNVLVSGGAPLYGMFGFQNTNPDSLIGNISFGGHISSLGTFNYAARFGVTGSQTITSGSDQIILWTRQDFNSGSLINPTTISSDGKFTFNYLGNFLINVSIPIQGATNGAITDTFQENIQIYDPKGNNPITILGVLKNGIDQVLQLTACVNVTSTSDQYWITAYQNSGVSLNTTITGLANARLSITQ